MPPFVSVVAPHIARSVADVTQAVALMAVAGQRIIGSSWVGARQIRYHELFFKSTYVVKSKQRTALVGAGRRGAARLLDRRLSNVGAGKCKRQISPLKSLDSRTQLKATMVNCLQVEEGREGRNLE